METVRQESHQGRKRQDSRLSGHRRGCGGGRRTGRDEANGAKVSKEGSLPSHPCSVGIREKHSFHARGLYGPL